MKPEMKKEPELKPQEESVKEPNQAESETSEVDFVKKSKDSHPGFHSSRGMELDEQMPMLARVMSAIEMRDDKDMSIEFAKNPAVQAELEMVTSLESAEFLGIIANCKIAGCDVHALNKELEIIKHFSVAEEIEEGFVKARAAAATMPESVIAILVFTTHYAFLHINGSVEVYK